MKKLTVKDIETEDKKVLVRVDFNVPIDERTGEIADDSRIRAALPTINYLIEGGARIILCSHLGRPGGKVVEGLRMGPIAERLEEMLGRKVKYCRYSVGKDVSEAVSGMRAGDVLLLENIRFLEGEKKNDAELARELASFADVYVNDAFGTSHRSHASIEAITRHLPSVAGLLLEREIEALGGIIESPEHPFATLLGGAKVSDKVGIIDNIMDKVDYILIGGGMAATFLKAKSLNVGQSIVEKDKLDVALSLMEKAERSNVRMMFPVDVMVAGEISREAKAEVEAVEKIGDERQIVDIGPRTIRAFENTLHKCRTVFWNGPMGVYEIPQFASGTRAMASTLAEIDATTVIGGGSTADMVAEMGLEGKMSFVSTGGGASLEFIGGEKLPGIEALPDKES
ncbi:MAG: phosphoglycerate kinase [Dehalococcoidales bacterium]